jgi:hypothetical protein
MNNFNSSSVEKLEKSAFEAIKLLRRKKFEKGLPFMINSDMLDSDQCFLEYPDGSIKIVEADPERCDFRIVFEYDINEANRLRRKLRLV